MTPVTCAVGSSGPMRGLRPRKRNYFRQLFFSPLIGGTGPPLASQILDNPRRNQIRPHEIALTALHIAHMAINFPFGVAGRHVVPRVNRAFCPCTAPAQASFARPSDKPKGEPGQALFAPPAAGVCGFRLWALCISSFFGRSGSVLNTLPFS